MQHDEEVEEAAAAPVALVEVVVVDCDADADTLVAALQLLLAYAAWGSASATGPAAGVMGSIMCCASVYTPGRARYERKPLSGFLSA